MGSNYFTNPLIFIVDVVFSLYILAVMLRLLLQIVRADFYNPLSQALVKITNPPLKPLRRIIPGVGGVDLASIVLLLALQITAVAVVFALAGRPIDPVGLVFESVAELVALLINVFIFAILIQVILSWVNPGAYNPATVVLYSLTEPVLRPARRVIPPLGGLDLSPLVAMVVLQVIKMLVLPPIRYLGALVG